MGKSDPDRLLKLRRQIRGNTKAATVPRAKYQRRKGSTKKALEFCRTFPPESPEYIHVISTCTWGNYLKPGTEPPERSKKNNYQSSPRDDKSSQSEEIL